MNNNNYLMIFCTGIAEHYEHLESYIKRAKKDASENLIEESEFFGRLEVAINQIEQHYFIDKFNMKLNRYYHYLELDNVNKSENKFGYPKPDIEENGQPFYFISGQQYNEPSSLFMYHIRHFRNAIETVRNPKISIENVETKLSVKTFALVHIFWGKIESSKAITKTNVKSIAQEYEISHNTLLTAYLNYFEKDKRKPETESKKSVKPFIAAFQEAVIRLGNVCPAAYKIAEEELDLLKVRYEEYLK